MAVMYGVWSFTVAAVVSLLLVVGVRPVSPLLQDVRAPHIRSPCQQVFDYRVRSDHYVFGLLTVPSPPVQRRSVPLLVAFQLRARLPTKYGGLIELRRTQSETVHDIRQRRHVQFIIHFPVQTPLPHLTMVMYDNVLLCTTSAGVAPVQQFASGRPAVVNRIEFRYAFDTSDLAAEPALETTPMPSTSVINAKWFSPTSQSAEPTTSTTTTVAPTRRPRQPHCGQLHKDFVSTATATAIDDDSDTGRHLTLERGAWPWLTAIYTIRPTGPRFLCAGSLVSSTLILTAASCLTATIDTGPNKPAVTKIYQPDELLVMLGRHNLSTWFEPGTVIRELASLHVHPEYRFASPSEADVAVLVMRSAVEYGTFVMPVCLWQAPPNAEAAMLGAVGTVVGWGGTDPRHTEGSGRINPIPESMTISVVPRRFCHSAADATSTERSHNFCAGTRNGRRTCVGVSGSGYIALHDNRLALRGVMAGDASAGDGSGLETTTCDEREYYVFTDVSTFIDWIEAFMD